MQNLKFAMGTDEKVFLVNRKTLLEIQSIVVAFENGSEILKLRIRPRPQLGEGYQRTEFLEA